jgi:Type II secretory pathway, prepilin signal peptidase PulO and related peptidases
MAVLFYVQSGLSVEFAAGIVYSAFLLGVAFMDYEQGLILNKVLWGLAVTGLLANIFLRHFSLADIFVGSLLGGGVLLFLLVLTNGGMGGGDIKFGAALGIWLGWQNSLLMLLGAFMLGGLAGFLLLCFGRKHYGDSIPFGPFLAVGGWLSYFYGQEIMQFYWELF